jgi:hypothetical protein
MAVNHHSEPLELVKVAVDGGDVNIRSEHLDLGGQLFCTPVGSPVEETAQQEPTRGGDPRARSTKELEHLLHTNRPW